MVDVGSGDVLAMRDSSVGDLIDDLNAKQAQLPLGPLLGLSTFAICVLVLMLVGNAAPSFATSGIAASAVFATILAWIIGVWLDQSLRRAVLVYNLETEAASKFERVTAEFDALAACRGKWHIQSGGEVRDLTTWKRNAGAAHLLDRKSATLNYRLPTVLKSNVTPPAINLGLRVFYFFPETIIVQDGRKFGALAYANLHIRWQQSRFIEDGHPPADAQVIGHAWKHPNKGGGPDRRFKDNRQLPVCLYEVMHLSSESGVNELVEFSRVGIIERFATALRNLPQRPASESLLTIASR